MHLPTRTKVLLGAAASAAIVLPLLVVAPTTASAATCTAPTSLAVSITAPTRVIYPQKALITGVVTDPASGLPACGADISVTAVSGGGTGVVQYASKVGATGAFAVALWLGRTTQYTANASFTGLTSAASTPQTVTMFPRIGITSVKPTVVKRGGTIYVVGYVQPGQLNVKPWLQVFDKTASWHKVATAYFISSTGVWSLKWVIPATRHVGVASIRAVLPPTPMNGPGTSSARTITVV